MLEFLKTLDRRWIFLAMLLAVAVPILAQKSFPEKPTKLVQDAFDAIEDLDEGSNVLLSFDYSPSSDGELAPMATAFVRHCCLKRHKMFFMTLWPDGLPLLNRTIEAVVETELAGQKFEYGKDYVNLGYNPGREVAIIVMGTNLRKMFPSDVNDDDLDDIPLTANISSLQDMKLIIDITTGNPGAKEWVQYAASPYQDKLKLVIGATAVQAPQAYPYLPNQLQGLLAAIKGAAEYEAALGQKYPQYRDPKYNDGIRRMAPQFWGHLLVIALILLGNGIYFAERLGGGRPIKRETLVWTILFVAGGLFLLYRAAFTPHGMGKSYVKEVRINPKSETDQRMKFAKASVNDPQRQLSYPRTVGLWLSAFFTLAIFSFLYRDNVFYKVAESIMVGVSAGWAMASAGFWEAIVPKLMANLAPALMREWALPDLKEPTGPNYVYLVPLVLGVMLLWRLAPRGGWIARWPLAFIVGTYAGIRLVSFIEADFVNQIKSTIVPLVMYTQAAQIDIWGSLRNAGLVFGVLACLTYFFFSIEHRGVAGKIARVGVWYLMLTFGASFAFTVMGRIALLASRLAFLFDDWLWLIDPSGKRPW